MRPKVIIASLAGCLLLSACSNENDSSRAQIETQRNENPTVQMMNQSQANDRTIKAQLVHKYKGQTPREWGETVTGVYTSLNTNDKVIALTLDACGGPGGNAYDAELIYYLRKMNIPANHRKIQNLTGTAPRFFRSGTAFYDDIGVKVVGELGERVVNKPNGYTAEGIKAAIPQLIKRGYRFVKLTEFPLR